MELQAFEIMPDHVHFLFDALPQVNLAEFVNALKSASSRMVRKEHGDALKSIIGSLTFGVSVTLSDASVSGRNPL